MIFNGNSFRKNKYFVSFFLQCSVKCGHGIELGFGLNCFTRQMPIRKLNATECELAGPHLPKPSTKRTCRRSCVEWRTSDWSEVNTKKNQTSLALDILLVLIACAFIYWV